MIITEKFIYIHRPKTGGSFVTDALLKLYGGKWNFWKHAKLAIFKEIHFKNVLGTLTFNANKHGGCSEIQPKYKDRSIVSTIRNPYDYYVSQYEFGWWKRNDMQKYYKNVDRFSERFASFPALSFTQFMELMTAALNEPPFKDFYNQSAMGRYTAEFIKDYFYDSNTALDKLSADYFKNGVFKQDMFPVKYIFTHSLNQQLHQYLKELDYPEEDIEFILKKEKMLPQGKGRTSDQKWQTYYTPELKELVRKKDWFLFELFPEFEE